jgi:hypothetical protein
MATESKSQGTSPIAPAKAVTPEVPSSTVETPNIPVPTKEETLDEISAKSDSICKTFREAKLDKIREADLKGELDQYEQAERKIRNASNDKLTAYLMMKDGIAVAERRYKRIGKYFKQIGYDAQTRKTTITRVVKGEEKEIPAVELIYSLKDAIGDNLVEVVKAVIDHFPSLDPEFKKELVRLNEALKTDKKAVMSPEIREKYAEDMKLAQDWVDSDFAILDLKYDKYAKKLSSSIKLVNATLALILEYRADQELLKEEAKRLPIMERVKARVADDTKFASLKNIADKYDLSKCKA